MNNFCNSLERIHESIACRHLIWRVEMLQHKCICSRKKVVNEHHRMIMESFSGKNLSQCDKISMLELFPLVDENHALCVDQSEPVDAP